MLVIEVASRRLSHAALGSGSGVLDAEEDLRKAKRSTGPRRVTFASRFSFYVCNKTEPSASARLGPQVRMAEGGGLLVNSGSDATRSLQQSRTRLPGRGSGTRSEWLPFAASLVWSWNAHLEHPPIPRQQLLGLLMACTRTYLGLRVKVRYMKDSVEPEFPNVVREIKSTL